MTSNVSDIAREVDVAFWLVGGVCILLLIGVTIAMVTIVLKYRRSRVKKVSQFEGNLKLEITWVVIPTIIVTWMFYVAYVGFEKMRNPPDDAMVVKVTGRQWAWEFAYPDSGVTSREMVVPVNTPVKVLLHSPDNDVLHSFYLPDFRVKEDVVPGKETYLWFESKRTGTFNIFCAEFCGKGHSEMLSLLHVVTEDEYKKWTETQIAKRYMPLTFEGVENPQDPTFGKDALNIDAKLLFGTYCASCHGQAGDGSGLPGVARDFRTTKEWKNGQKISDILKTLYKGIPETQMRAFPNLTPWEAVALGHYVRSFNKDPLPKDTRADYEAMVKELELDKLKGPGKTIPVEKAMEILAGEAEEGAK